jgi:hypothetical protein
VAAFGRPADSLDASGDSQRNAVSQVSGATWKGAAAKSARSATVKVLDAYRTASALARDGCDTLSQCATDWATATDEWRQAGTWPSRPRRMRTLS